VVAVSPSRLAQEEWRLNVNEFFTGPWVHLLTLLGVILLLLWGVVPWRRG
jgi:hypothetical protein